jgi:hypothetical protein
MLTSYRTRVTVMKDKGDYGRAVEEMLVPGQKTTALFEE